MAEGQDIETDPRRVRCADWFDNACADVLPPFRLLPEQVRKALFKEELNSFDLELLFRYFVIMDLPSLWVWKLVSVTDCYSNPGGAYGYRRRVVPLEWYFEWDKIKLQD